MLLDNIGHSENAQHRPLGGAAKVWRQDLQYSCKRTSVPVPGLVIECQNVRGVRVPWQRGDRWLFERDSQLIKRDEPRLATPAQASSLRRTWYMEAVSQALEFDAAAGRSKTSLRSAVGCKAEYVDQAVGTLVNEGYLGEQEGRDPRDLLIRSYRQTG